MTVGTAAAAAERGSVVSCGLCGHTFRPDALACHARCPLGSHCNLVCCPRCGYQTVNEERSTLARLLRRAFSRTGPAAPNPTVAPEGHAVAAAPPGAPAVVPLTHVPAGMRVEVAEMGGLPAPDLSRLIALGIAPGATVEVLQRRPAAVVRAGETDVALGPDVLDGVWVRVPGQG